MLSVEFLSLSSRFEASLPFVDELGFMVSAMSDRPSADFIVLRASRTTAGDDNSHHALPTRCFPLLTPR